MIKRTVFSKLEGHLNQKEITLIVGPRQAGKTTLMLWLKDNLEKNNQKTLFLNLDIESDRQYFFSQEALIKKIELEMGQKSGFVFIDEIQRKENAGLFLKGIYDMNLPYKFIVSGSGSIELKEKIHESLAGRKRIFELGTLSFLELINFKTDYRYEDKIVDFLSLEKEKTNQFLLDYLDFGGYPRVVLADTQEEKSKIIDEIYQSYVEKDLSYLLGVQKTEDFSRLLRIVADQTGQLARFSELSSTLGISAKTVDNYLWYAQKTFILNKVTPYFKNIRKEITKSPVFYFSDLGLRNYTLGVFGRIRELENKGFVFQNFIFNLLREVSGFANLKINFWRSKDRAEVDFVLDRGREIVPIEVKYQTMRKSKISRSLRSFIARYHPSKALVVNLDLDKWVNVSGTKILFLPFYKLITHSFSSILPG